MAYKQGYDMVIVLTTNSADLRQQTKIDLTPRSRITRTMPAALTRSSQKLPWGTSTQANCLHTTIFRDNITQAQAIPGAQKSAVRTEVLP